MEIGDIYMYIYVYLLRTPSRCSAEINWQASEASELNHVRVQLRFQIRKYIYICIYMWRYVKLYAHAR